MEIICLQGTITYITIGMPNEDFMIGEASDDKGNSLSISDVSSGTFYGVRVTLYSPISNGESYNFTVLTNVGHMIWKDDQNPGNEGMSLIPSWWNTEVDDLKIAFVMPPGVTIDKVRSTPNWDNASTDSEEDRLVIYWERSSLLPNTKLTFGISFPEGYIQQSEEQKEFSDWILPLFVIIIVVSGIVILIVLRRRGPKKRYVSPKMQMETLGIRRGLTAVEASYLLDLKPTKIVSEILYGLLLKRIIWVRTSNPSLKIELIEESKEQSEPESTVHYYEKSFLKAIQPNGTLKEELLAKTVVLIRETTEAKLKGYSRYDTITYYKRIVAEAWKQVEKAGTQEQASEIYNEQLLWLLLDGNVQSETKRIFKDRSFIPHTNWWWYWYIFNQRSSRSPSRPSPSDAPPPSIPGADLADGIATSIENTANNIVRNIEKFANSILPTPTPKRTSRRSTRRGSSCVCACASCACVCACVSCACACASGGVG